MIALAKFPWRLGRPVILGGFLFVVGCAGNTQVVPDPSTPEALGYWKTEVSQVAGVRVLAAPDAWTGDPEVLVYVIPIRVTLENQGKVPIRLRFDKLSPIDPHGVRLAALPPFDIKGSEEPPVPSELNQPVKNPESAADGFQVAPYGSDLYPELTPYPDEYNYDRQYNDTYSTYWEDTPLPTAGMVNKAIPEGVVLPGGAVSGFVYFQRPEWSGTHVRFQLDLVNDGTGEIFGVVTIPFLLQRS